MVQRDLWGTKVDIEIPDGVFPDEKELKELDERFNNPEHGYFEGTYQGKKLFYRKYLPKNGGKPKGVIAYQHGIHGQSGFGFKSKDGRWADFALRCRKFTEAGYAVYGSDQLGHGFSEGVRFMIPNGNWKINRDDLVKFVTTVVAKEQPDVPLFIVGDSYGGCLAIHAARWFQDHPEEAPAKFHGILLNAPAVIGDLPPAPVVAVLRRLAVLTPSWTPFFMPHPVSAERCWKDLEAREHFMSQTNRLENPAAKFCLGTALGLLTALEAVRTDVIPGLKIPFSVNHGTDDGAVLIEGSEFLMDKSATPAEDKVLNKIEGARHDFYSELEAEQTMKLELDWIKARIAKQQKS